MSLVLASQEGRVRILTLNRPEARNALDAAIRKELIGHLQEAEGDALVGAIVLTGAGKAFAAGADLRELAARSSEEQEHFLQPPNVYSVIEGLRKPVVAAVNGHALGAGLELATACDVRLAVPGAKLGQPEVSLGLIPGGGGTQRLPRLVGPGHAARLVLTGEPVDGAEALRIGLVDLLAPPEALLSQATALAAQMARHDAETVAAAKRSLACARDMPYRDALATEIGLFVRLHARAESRSLVQKFLER